MRHARLLAFLICIVGCSADAGGESGYGNGEPAGEGGAADAGSGGQNYAGSGGQNYAGSGGQNYAGSDGGQDASPIIPQAIELRGCNGYYTIATSIGGSQTFELALDTGSATLAVAAKGCTSCASAGLSNLYVPAASATDFQKAVTATYGDGSGFWTGEIWRDAVVLGGVTPTAAVRFVAISSEQNFFSPSTCKSGTFNIEGILGYGPAQLASDGTDATADMLAKTGMPNVFAVELCDDGGKAWIGGYDPGAWLEPAQWTPMPADQPYYSISVTDVGLAGKSVGVDPSSYPEAIVDTGGPLLYLPQSVFDALSAAIAELPGFQQLFKQGASFFNSFDGCVELTKAQIDDALPAFTMTFGTGNTAFSLDAKASESYLQPEYDSNGTEVWCTGIGTFPGGIPYTVIGGSWLRSHIVIFDRENHRMGFAPHSPCP